MITLRPTGNAPAAFGSSQPTACSGCGSTSAASTPRYLGTRQTDDRDRAEKRIKEIRYPLHGRKLVSDIWWAAWDALVLFIVVAYIIR